MKKFELDDVSDVFSSLESSGFQGILVGGHAVNFWARHYRSDNPEWNALLPYTSEDLDFLGGRAEALLCKKLFGGTANLNDGTDPSPQAGVILAPINGTIVRLDIIISIVGVESRKAAKSALPHLEEHSPKTSLRVLHPLHCLISKTAALAQLPQAGRQDLKHLKLSVLFLREYLLEKFTEPRALLNNIEQVFFMATNELGLRVWNRHGVEIEKALPLETISSQGDERLQKFSEVRLPQLVAQLKETRQRYLASLLES